MSEAVAQRPEEDIEPPLTTPYELERGKPMPSVNHSRVQTRLVGEFLKHPEFDVFGELNIELNGSSYVPDLCVYHRQPSDWQDDVLRRTDPPLVAVEILSARQSYYDVMRKLRTYLAAGVQSCWLVSPPIQNVVVYTPSAPSQSFSTSGVVTDPATGITADLAAVFA